ncbi:MAG: chitobiase/beta-hexosaminidase C-terminal domain-containing protein [Ruminiclostridium sp.]|nr:chitobiase/beta-hexosaminidase C-terminal domain-containing protein [Ruminiclostridium sp.]
MKKSIKYLCTILLAMLILLTSILPAIASSEPTAPVVYVATDGSGDFNCDGGDNDQVEIQQAIDFVLANEGFTTVRLKAGTYTIDDTIYIAGKQDQKVIFESEESTVVLLSPTVCWPVHKAMIENKTTAMIEGTNYVKGNFIIRGFKLDGNGPNITQALNSNKTIRAMTYPSTNGINYYNLIYLQTCNDIEVNNMYLTHNFNDGLQVKSCTNVEFHDNIIDEIGHDGLYAYKCDYVNAYNNVIYIQTNSGLRASSTNHVKFYNNIISAREKGGPGIEIQKENMINNPNGYSYMTDIEIFDNIIYDIKYAGIWIFGNATAPQYSFPPEDTFANVHHNIIYNCGYYEGAGDAASNLRLKGGIVTDGFSALIENNVIDSCGAAGINVHEWLPSRPSPEGTYTLTIRNNIISNTKNNVLVGDSEGSGYGIFYELGLRHNFIVNYNCFFNNNGADFKNFEPASAAGNLFGYDPLFADAENHDYHLMSEYGRWDGNSFVKDQVTSPCIDAGEPSSDYTNEPMENGGIINIGRYGNTSEASKSILKVAAPVASLEPGTYSEPQKASLSCATEGAVIRYTTDGSDPDMNSKVYIKPIDVEPLKTVIKAVAFKDGMVASNVVTFEYKIDPTIELPALFERLQGIQERIEEQPPYKQQALYQILANIVKTFEKFLDTLENIMK